MFLRLTFASGIIEIKFIINDATRPVIRFMRMANNIHTALPIPLTGYRPNISDQEKDHVNKTYNNITQAIYALRDDLGYKWPGNVSDKFLYPI